MIALFDSGYGGLTVLKPIMEALPGYDYLYLGDNGRTPYGGHSQEKIQHFAEQAVEYLFDRGVTLIIFACNTASGVALRYVQKKYLRGKEETDKKILGVLIPAVEKAAEITKNKRVAVVGTRATVEAGTYEAEMKKIDPKIKIYGKACPLLVPFIEEGWHKKPEAISILKKYLRPIKSYDVDTLILGCTHYPLMSKDFQRIMGKSTRIIHSGEATAEKLKDYLQRHPEIDSKLSKGGTRKFLTTDSPERFKAFTEKNFGMKIKMPERVEL